MPIAPERPPSIATVIQMIFERAGTPSDAIRAAVKAKGRANTE
jgi:hypothetical protein